MGRLACEAGQYRTLVLVLAYTDIRWGEVVALRVKDVEFLRRLSVAGNAVQLGVDHAVGHTKSRAQRSVPIPAFVLDELSVQCEGWGHDDLVFGDGTNYLPRPKSAGGWFAGAVKRQRCRRSLRTIYATPVRRWRSAQVSTPADYHNSVVIVRHRALLTPFRRSRALVAVLHCLPHMSEAGVVDLRRLCRNRRDTRVSLASCRRCTAI